MRRYVPEGVVRLLASKESVARPGVAHREVRAGMKRVLAVVACFVVWAGFSLRRFRFGESEGSLARRTTLLSESRVIKLLLWCD